MNIKNIFRKGAGTACCGFVAAFMALPMMTAYKKLGADISNYPNAYNQYKNEITLPLYTKLTDEQVDYILKNFKEVI